LLTFLLIGWIWAINTGCIITELAKKNERNIRQQSEKEDVDLET